MPKAVRQQSELRRAVEEKCREELVQLATAVNADEFLEGLQEVRRRREADKVRLRMEERADELLDRLFELREQADQLLRFSGGAALNVGAVADLRVMVDLLARRRELFRVPKEERQPPIDDFTHRELVLREYDKPDFFGTGRPATVRELAVLSLFMDPEHGCSDSRPGRHTAYQIIELEMDALRQARKRLER